jgi:type I restriction enzyme R subunit
VITEDQLEQQCLGWFREGGWETVFGPDIAHEGFGPSFTIPTMATVS